MPDLAVESGDRCRHDDHTAFPLGVGGIPLHGDGGRLGDQHGADQIDFNHFSEEGAGHGALFSDHSRRRCDACAIDRRIDRAHPLEGAVDRAVDRGFIAHISGDEGGPFAERRGGRAALGLIDIQERDFAAGLHDSLCDGKTKPRGAARDDGMCFFQLHG